MDKGLERQENKEEEMARPARFERATAWFVARYSIQLSYGRLILLAEREGFEPSIRVNVYTLSRGAPSATRPPLLVNGAYSTRASPKVKPLIRKTYDFPQATKRLDSCITRQKPRAIQKNR